MTVLIKPTGFALGAEVVGADLTKPLDDTTFAQIRAAFYKHEVLYFRGQALSDEDHIRFTARFGELRQLKLASQSHVQHAEIYVISNIMKDGKHIGSYDAGVLWHTDGAYLAKPHAISALRALEVPVQNGRTLGDTHFASTSAAYEALPPAMQLRLNPDPNEANEDDEDDESEDEDEEDGGDEAEGEDEGDEDSDDGDDVQPMAFEDASKDDNLACAAAAYRILGSDNYIVATHDNGPAYFGDEDGLEGYTQSKDLSPEGWEVYEHPEDILALPYDHEDRKSTRLNSSHVSESRMPSSA